MLDRTAEITPQSAGTPAPGEGKHRPGAGTQRPGEPAGRYPFAGLPGRVAQVYAEGGLRGVARRAGQFFVSQSFSSLTRRIVSLNVAGLVALVVGILYLSQFRAGLIDARVESLVVQGEIIAGAIASSASADSYGTYIDRDRLLELQPGENYGDEGVTDLEFSINPERVAPVLRRLISPTKTRARIYDRAGYLILDSRNLYIPGEVMRLDLPPPNEIKPNIFKRAWNSIRVWLSRGGLPRYYELAPEAGKDYPEVAQALGGAKSASMVRINDRGEVIVSVAVPVQRFRAVRGALLLSTQGGDINQAVEAERLQIVKLFLILLGVMVVLSILLARTIAGPVKRLADGAERVRHRIRSRVEIPDLTARRDEIGDLSGALRDMTNALYSRIEAIESFAADVAHELKNPLTSLRSAVETMPLAKSKESQQRLLEVIQHDVRRLDRLISDISDASRLDAELQRDERAPVDLAKLLNTVISVQNEIRKADGAKVSVNFEGGGPHAFIVPGHDSRLGQVINNLIDNARSFAPPDSTVRVTCRKLRGEVEIVVDDDGPGIRPEAFDKIFERFYTDRPHQSFGQNSGLGLSISKQIIEAHRGRLSAENRVAIAKDENGEPKVLGARFAVRLPSL
ncbi:MAG: two-component system, OmpR family, sensor histidine kinase ChvG [Alphaproteobacteria bacterium]|nr:two-component system, OmpR family, sensor histidine kinase ChvG [Alphaproteobacteria bacterium]